MTVTATVILCQLMDDTNVFNLWPRIPEARSKSFAK